MTFLAGIQTLAHELNLPQNSCEPKQYRVRGKLLLSDHGAPGLGTDRMVSITDFPLQLEIGGRQDVTKQWKRRTNAEEDPESARILARLQAGSR